MLLLKILVLGVLDVHCRDPGIEGRVELWNKCDGSSSSVLCQACDWNLSQWVTNLSRGLLDHLFLLFLCCNHWFLSCAAACLGQDSLKKATFESQRGLSWFNVTTRNFKLVISQSQFHSDATIMTYISTQGHQGEDWLFLFNQFLLNAWHRVGFGLIWFG